MSALFFHFESIITYLEQKFKGGAIKNSKKMNFSIDKSEMICYTVISSKQSNLNTSLGGDV